MQRHFIPDNATHTPCGLPRSGRFVYTLERMRANPPTALGAPMCEECLAAWGAVEAALTTLRKIETNVDGLEAQTEMVMRLAFKGVAQEDPGALREALTRLQRLHGCTSVQAIQLLSERFVQITETI